MNTIVKKGLRPAPAMDLQALQNDEAFCAGYQSFIWGYPYVKGTLLRRAATHPGSANYAPINCKRLMA